MLYLILFVAAVIPVVALCYFIYARDVNREPAKLLATVFILGFFSAIPVVIIELILGMVFTTENVTNLVQLFINVFIGVALIEEGFKWIITKLVAFNNKEFDEVYDIIVYSVFASLGFACIENILYVIQGGLGLAVMRGLLSIPGHTCFGVIMGYFFAQAKLGKVNGNKNVQNSNFVFSILAPTLVHTAYDTILFGVSALNSMILLIVFFVFDIAMVVLCFFTVFKMSKIQQKLNKNLETGVIFTNPNGLIGYNGETTKEINFCPVCGQSARGYNYCKSCGFKLK